MKPLRDFLALLEQKDIRLWVEDDGLRFRAPKDALTPDLRQELAARKQEVIAALAPADAQQPIAPLPAGAAIPISYAQQRLWFLAGMERDSPVYNVFACYVVTGALNAKALEDALAALVQRHHSLRMSFPEAAGQAVVKLLEAYAPLQIADLSHLSGAPQRAALDRHVEALSRHHFDLATGPLFQARLLVLGDDKHALLFAMHHIISDGWSMGVLYRELSQLYTAYSQNDSPALAPLPIHYGDYAAWQRQRLSGASLDKLLDYWRGQLDGAPELLALPTDRPRPPLMSYRGGHFQTRLDAATAQQLRSLSRQQGCTLFMTLLAAFYVLLARYSGQRDIAVGVPIANRTQPQTHGLIGFFVNTLVMRAGLGEEQSFLDLLHQVRQTAIGAYDHQELPFEYLVEQLNPQRSLAYAPLFQVTFSLMGEPMEQLQLPKLRVEPLPDRDIVPYSKFDLGLLLMEQKDGLLCTWEYAADLFDGASVERMARHYETLLQAILQDPGRCIDDLPLLPAEEAALIQAWNRQAAAYGPEWTVIDQFEDRAARYPDHTALVCRDVATSYRELNRRANRLARRLLAQGVAAETVVAVCLESSLEMVAAILAIHKAGGIHLPIDPNYPNARLAFVLEDSRANLLLTRAPLLQRFAELPAVETLCLEEDAAAGPDDDANPARTTRPSDAAYIIYTSGSTGRPKGVVIEHRGLSNTAAWCMAYFGIQPTDRCLQAVNVAFDAIMLDLWPCLCSGAALHVADPGILASNDELKAWLDGHAITLANLPTPIAESLLNDGWRSRALTRLYTGGDRLHRYLPETANFKFYNLYGPTECSIVSSATPVLPKRPSDPEFPTIGGPIANTQIFILDGRNNPLPIGVPGELCIAGIGLARGYLNRPELTGEKFCEIELFSRRERVYKSGDLARFRSLDGTGTDLTIEFLGRIDQQVKLRGFRIELGEIESALAQHAAVDEAVVLLYDQRGEKRLVAYVTPAAGANADELRAWLKAWLPEYMVPADFIALDKLPLTPNGKVDKAALPEPDLSSVNGPLETESASDETETLLCSLWSQVLGMPITNVRSDFFRAGGHSLVATQLASRLRDSFGVEVPVKAIFEYPVLKDLAAWLRRQQGAPELPPLVPLAEGEEPVLSFAQRRLWFLAKLDGQSTTYNIPAALRLEGELDRAALQGALQALMQRHVSLRLCFPEIDGRPALRVRDGGAPLAVTDLSGLSEDDRQQELNRLIAEHALFPFDLAAGPLIDLRLVKLGEASHVLLLNLHHIISDGWSMGIFLREWRELYDSQVEGRPPRLAEPRVQYTDYAAWQRGWLQGEFLERQLQYWETKLAGAPALLHLPTDAPRPALMSYNGARLKRVVPPAVGQRLEQLGREHSATLYMVLLAAFDVLLYRYSGCDDILVGSPIANRTHSRTEDIVGLFVNTLVLRTRIDETASFIDLLAAVRRTALEAYAHQDIPFEYLVERLKPQRSLSYSPLFQVMFSLQNAPMEALELAGLNVSFLPHQYPIAKYDLTLDVVERSDGLHCHWEYCSDLFQADTVQAMAEHFALLLEAIAADAARCPQQFPILPQEEAQRLRALGQAREEFPGQPTVVGLFDQRAKATPHHPALLSEAGQLSYRELAARADHLAGHLLSLGVQSGDIVAICMERGCDMVAALLGVLKAGDAYLPIDPHHPQARIALLLEECGTRLVLTQRGTLDGLPTGSASAVAVDTLWQALPASPDAIQPIDRSRPDSLAYVIYTSGSTGRPKGVAVEHAALAGHWHAMQRIYRIEPQDRVLNFAAFTFDVALEQITAALLAGATLVLPPHDVLDGQRFLQFMQRWAVTVADLPPAYWQQVLTLLEKTGELPSALRLLILGGEALDAGLAQRTVEFLANRPELKVLNAYGPTEAVITATVFQVDGGMGQQRFAASAPIGLPIANAGVHILDRHHVPVPIGVPGELCISGALARGYLNRPELTERSFIEAEIFGRTQRLYKTGDQARWARAGEDEALLLEFLGRMDHQVKLRGFRIEPGEIEAVLARHESIREAAVILAPQLGQLAAFLTGQPPENLREWLKQQLPDYMVPASFATLPALPLTSAGKVDRAALAGMIDAGGGADTTPDYVAPRSPVEERLCEIWQSLLGRERIGIHDDFFALGGHSLLMTELTYQIREVFQTEVSLRRLFEAPSVAAMAGLISHGEGATPALDLAGEAVLEPDIVPTATWPTAAPQKLLLTGATGFLGIFLLHELLQQTSADIHCLVRCADAEEGRRRLRDKLQACLIWDEAFAQRIVAVPGDLAQPGLGVAPQQYRQLAEQMDGIYHNGALVNHVYPYEALKAANVLGTKEILRLAVAGGKTKPVHYVSSILSTEGGDAMPLVQESDFPAAEQVAGQGYPQTKWVAEKLMRSAAERGVPVYVYRPTRVCGHSQTGVSNGKDFVNLLLQGCLRIGMVPPIYGVCDNLVPVDYASRALVHLSQQRELAGKTFHLSNPHSTPLRELFQWAQSYGHRLEEVPYPAWKQALAQSRDNPLYPYLANLPEDNVFARDASQDAARIDCRNTLQGLAGSNIFCPVVDRDLFGRQL